MGNLCRWSVHGFLGNCCTNLKNEIHWCTHDSLDLQTYRSNEIKRENKNSKDSCGKKGLPNPSYAHGLGICCTNHKRDPCHLTLETVITSIVGNFHGRPSSWLQNCPCKHGSNNICWKAMKIDWQLVRPVARPTSERMNEKMTWNEVVHCYYAM